MSSNEVIQLVDPDGSELLIGKIDDTVYTLAANFVDGQPFRMFEDNRARLRQFLRPLAG